MFLAQRDFSQHRDVEIDTAIARVTGVVCLQFREDGSDLSLGGIVAIPAQNQCEFLRVEITGPSSGCSIPASREQRDYLLVVKRHDPRQARNIEVLRQAALEFLPNRGRVKSKSDAVIVVMEFDKAGVPLTPRAGNAIASTPELANENPAPASVDIFNHSLRFQFVSMAQPLQFLLKFSITGFSGRAACRDPDATLILSRQSYGGKHSLHASR